MLGIVSYLSPSITLPHPQHTHTFWVFKQKSGLHSTPYNFKYEFFSPGSSADKEFACNTGDPRSIAEEDPLKKGKHTLTGTIHRLHSLVFTQMSHLCPHKNLNTDIYSSFMLTAKLWKQTRCPSVGEWTDKLLCIQMMKYYSVLTRN